LYSSVNIAPNFPWMEFIVPVDALTRNPVIVALSLSLTLSARALANGDGSGMVWTGKPFVYRAEQTDDWWTMVWYYWSSGPLTIIPFRPHLSSTHQSGTSIQFLCYLLADQYRLETSDYRNILQ
jgi:hypothetical protein